MLERGAEDMMIFVPGDLIERVQKNPKMMLARSGQVPGGRSLGLSKSENLFTISACVRR